MGQRVSLTSDHITLGRLFLLLSLLLFLLLGCGPEGADDLCIHIQGNFLLRTYVCTSVHTDEKIPLYVNAAAQKERKMIGREEEGT